MSAMTLTNRLLSDNRISLIKNYLANFGVESSNPFARSNYFND
jgi:hypothetical protein